mmetsp:Transcript_11672/g.28073  ORF Transcript_11672/g.28073 Transcript_11672/m.28073 type:complete len:191 (-) Transcript_11672:164-736(-)|eukprot:CAMPEP_0113629940 /NCGR_PEP_ID=MMETSP0017_2-20120614/15549_1 /TAXON_ID=2856 /ORGANISM="Cylindrotheca closterium" /LENGTH=190 /DNA_ID=CAMNT_0000540371 /DNA_START=158 /DNA_END=730 /DNA_ORIENTATION=- /assembly_acc=CAM_ASM_000147
MTTNNANPSLSSVAKNAYADVKNLLRQTGASIVDGRRNIADKARAELQRATKNTKSLVDTLKLLREDKNGKMKRSLATFQDLIEKADGRLSQDEPAFEDALRVLRNAALTFKEMDGLVGSLSEEMFNDSNANVETATADTNAADSSPLKKRNAGHSAADQRPFKRRKRNEEEEENTEPKRESKKSKHSKE